MTDINFKLLEHLATKSHPLLNIADDFEAQLREISATWVGEVFTDSRTAHHLLDMVGIPRGKGYTSHLDARTWLVITQLGQLRDRLDRIIAWHAREAGQAGMVGDCCTECGETWPCDTRRMADGTYEDDSSEKGDQSD